MTNEIVANQARAAAGAASTGSLAFDRVNLTINTIIDVEYAAPAVDTRHPTMVVPDLPPTVVAFSVGASFPGVVTFKSTT
jgi:hypothetical protein